MRLCTEADAKVISVAVEPEKQRTLILNDLIRTKHCQNYKNNNLEAVNCDYEAVKKL